MTRDFSGDELVVGSVHGIRAWNVTPDGNLAGVTRPYVWRESTNQAECRKAFHTTECHEEQAQGWASGGYGSPRLLAAFAKTISGERWCECPMGCDDLINPGCECGFYAYYAGQPFTFGGVVAGIIEASGQITEGTKGFRAERARIVAICFPNPSGPPPFIPPTYSRWQRAALWSYAHGPRNTRLWEAGRQLKDAESRARVKHEHASRVGSPGTTPVTASRQALIAGNYPNVPVYRSLNTMLSAHPIDSPPEVESDGNNT